MAIVEPKDKTVAAYKGLHLYHGDISNCSMRVRMTLIEKDLDWKSHHIDLKKKENISDKYFAINPNGLVPTLIDNGVVHIESNEIIDHIDQTYKKHSLRSENEEEMLSWLKLAADLHVPAVKPYVYATMMQKKLKKSDAEQRKYDELQTNRELKDFHSKHAGQKAFGENDISQSLEILEKSFQKLEETLNGRIWIMGDMFSLADISWIPLHFVLIGCGYPFNKYSNITRWAENCSKRESFKQGILKWCPDFSKV